MDLSAGDAAAKSLVEAKWDHYRNMNLLERLDAYVDDEGGLLGDEFLSSDLLTIG